MEESKAPPDDSKRRRIEELKRTIHTETYQDYAIDRIAAVMSNIIFDQTRHIL